MQYLYIVYTHSGAVDQYHCDICDEYFIHHSKLERHFASVGHKRFEKLLELTAQASPSNICDTRLHTDHLQVTTTYW